MIACGSERPERREQLDDLVERRRVARARRDDREAAARRSPSSSDSSWRLAGAHPVAVALHGVDLAVVGDHAERLGERPGREGVGRVARVHERELRREPLVGEVRVERLQLQRRDHALVDEGAGRQRREVDAELVLGALAQPEGLAVELDAGERLPVVTGARRTHEELLEGGHRLAGEGAELRRVDRHLAPAEHRAGPPRRRAPRCRP